MTAKQFILLCGKNKNFWKTYKNENCMCKACRTIAFHCHICKFVTFLLRLLFRLLKLPIFSQMGHTQGSWCSHCFPLTRGKHVLPVTSLTIQVIVTTMASQHRIAVTNTAPWQLFIITTGIIIPAEHETILIWSTAWLIVHVSLRKKRMFCMRPHREKQTCSQQIMIISTATY